MAGERTLPGLGLTGYWDLGDNTWKPTNDVNLRTLSALVQPIVASILATLPGAPVQGDIHIASGIWGGGSANDIMIYDDTAWANITPSAGWKVYNAGTGKDMMFDGTNWIYPGDPNIVSDATTAFALADSHLDGRTVIEISNGGAITFTLTESLIDLGPVTVINTGGGNIAFAPGVAVTINSTFPNMKTQWGWATIIPKGSDVFHIGGNLEAA